jgi:hypothetical protein
MQYFALFFLFYFFFLLLHYPFFSALAAAVLRTLAGLDLPKDPLEILPFLVLISPLPILIIVYSLQLAAVTLPEISRKLHNSSHS